ncbi:hypothetical protein D3C86_1744800 [compost metagenome]
MSSPLQELVLQLVVAERQRQDDKWGASDPLPWGDWSLILGEEVGELQQAMLESRFTENQIAALAYIIEEAVQVAAVAVALVEDARRRLDSALPVEDVAR